MNIFFKELKVYRKSLIIWSLAIVFTIVSGMAKFAGLSEADKASNNILKDFPKVMQAVFGMLGFDLNKPSGYYGVLFVYIFILAAIHAVLLGSGIITKEERDKTSEFLYPKPVTRSSIISAKFSAAFVNILIFNLVSLVSSLAIAASIKSDSSIFEVVIKFDLVLLLIQLLFLSFGTAAAAYFKNPRIPGLAGAVVILSTYLVSILIQLFDNLNFLKFLTPFQYFNMPAISENTALDAVPIISSLLLTAGLIFATYYFLTRRDLRT